MRDPRRIHVVTLIDIVGDGGGAESLAAELLERLDPERHRRTLVLYGRPTTESAFDRGRLRAIQRLRDAGVEVMELDRHNRWDMGAWRPFLKLLRTGDVDVLHAHKFGPNVWATTFAHLRRPAVVIAHEHTWSYEGQPLRKLTDRFVVARGSDAFLAVSEADRNRMIGIEHIPPQSVRLLPNGIPTPNVPDGPDVRSELGVDPATPLVVAVGVFRAQKDFPMLVDAFARVLRTAGEAHLVLVGDGPTRAAVEDAVARLGLGDHVSLVGMRSDPLRYVAAADVAVNSSLFEGASLAIIEYMALGRAIVATAVGGTAELLDGGSAGRLVSPGDPAALAEALAPLLRDHAEARRLGQAALVRQRQEYDIAVQVRRLEALYAELLVDAVDRGRSRRSASTEAASMRAATADERGAGAD